MTFSVSILATGSELLDGRVLDTNSNFVARELADLGLQLKRVLLVDDDMDELLAGLRDLSAVSELILTSGGLGPTSDDLTRDLVARFFTVGVVEYPDAIKHLEEFYHKRGRVLDPSNLKQALLPAGSEMIPNTLGTAPGFRMTGPGAGSHNVTICSLSGVPKEFTKMFLDSVLPLIKESARETRPIVKHSLKTFGIPESIAGAIVQGCKLPSEIKVSFRAALPEVHITLKAPRGTNLEMPVARVKAALPQAVVYSEDEHVSFIQKIHATLSARAATVSTAESCTGGMVSSFLTECPGSSDVFVGGVVAYNNSVKEQVLSVPKEIIKEHGAVSAETVRSMAASVRDLLGATYGVAISGIAGPTGGTSDKPVGTFYVGICGPQGAFERRCFFMNERRSVRLYAAYVALDLLRRTLEGFEIPETYPVIGSLVAPQSKG